MTQDQPTDDVEDRGSTSGEIFFGMFFATLITIPVAALAHLASDKGTVVAIITFSIFLGVGTYYAKTLRSYLWQMLTARFTEPR